MLLWREVRLLKALLEVDIDAFVEAAGIGHLPSEIIR